jgi:aminoglycoside phosphotransferase family enzyme
MTGLAEKVRFLSDPDAHGGDVRDVDVRETHMSWVFLTERHVYKLKKPVTYPHLDFSTLEKRRANCEAEVRLNRRLADDVYLGLLALRRDAQGDLTLGGDGEVVDWLVHMKRLPEADMLDRRIESGRCTQADIERLAHLLGRFYAARPDVPDGEAFIIHLDAEQPINRLVLEAPDLPFRDAAAPLLDALDHARERLHPAIETRISSGAMVEGHGDLRPEHVCLNDTPKIIDCLEFDRRMRIIDPFDEVNYLGLECEVEGAAWIRPLLLGRLETHIGERPEPALMALYGTFRMLLRARLSAAHLLEEHIRKPEKWEPQTFRYLEIAAREALSLQSREGRTAIRSPAGT